MESLKERSFCTRGQRMRGVVRVGFTQSTLQHVHIKTWLKGDPEKTVIQNRYDIVDEYDLRQALAQLSKIANSQTYEVEIRELADYVTGYLRAGIPQEQAR